MGPRRTSARPPGRGRTPEMTETLDFGALPRRSPALAFVLVVHGPEGGRYPIDGTILVGKHPENDVVIDAPAATSTPRSLSMAASS